VSRELTPAQAAEVERYRRAYAIPEYRMGPDRQAAAEAMLRERPDLFDQPLLDVGCGRGELLAGARALGFRGGLAGVDPATGNRTSGTKPIPVYPAVAWDLPFADASFGTVVCLDVLEHLLPADEPESLLELARVASRRIVVAIGMGQSAEWKDLGELHVNLHNEAEWTKRLTAAWAGWTVRRRADRDVGGLSAAWEATR